MVDTIAPTCIARSCAELAATITEASVTIDAFVRVVHESRSELDGVLCELHAVTRTVERIRDDVAAFPPLLAGHTSVVLERCGVIVTELHGYISVLSSPAQTTDKRFRWIATRKNVTKLRSALEGYRAALGLAWDLVALIRPQQPGSGADGDADGRQTSSNMTCRPTTIGFDATMVKKEITRVIREMQNLTTKIQGESADNGAVIGLEHYLNDLQEHAIAADIHWDIEEARSPKAPSSIADGPDSAIGLSDDSALSSPTKDDGVPSSPSSLSPAAHQPTPPAGMALTIEEIEEMLDELRDTVPDRPPTPPPKALGRSISMHNHIKTFTPPILDRRYSYADSDYSRRSSYDSMIETPTILAPGRTISVSDRAAVAPFEFQMPKNFEPSLLTVATKTSSETSRSEGYSRVNRRISRMFSQIGRSSTETRDRDDASIAPSTPRSVFSRQSRRMSWSINLHVPLMKPPRRFVEEESNAVFGVSLQKSIQVAKSSAMTRHKGSGSSTRDFPLCVFSCVSYLRKNDGIKTPNIFGEEADSERVSILRELFSSGPSYGSDVDWQFFGVHEAAELIQQYLSQLAKPIVSESVAKRWIALSRQASMPGTHAIRLDQCIDFWEEALLGIRGPAKNLFKYLLNLWGDVADAADENDMTAERLAGCVIKSLMHLPPGKRDTDYVIALAFLIRRRSEYSTLLQGKKEKSKAAFEN